MGGILSVCLGLCKSTGSLAVGIPLGILPGIVTAMGLIGITLVRYPLNLYKTFRVTFITVVFKKRLKLVILLGLTIVQILYPLIAVIAAIVGSIIGWSGAMVHAIYNGENIFSRVAEIIWKDILKSYWKWHKEFYDSTLEYYDHPTGVPMNWDGTRYDVPNFGFRKTVLGVVMTVYGCITVTLGGAVILVVKYVPLHLRPIKDYVANLPELFTFTKIVLLPFWVCGLPILLGLGPVVLVLCLLSAPLLGLRVPYMALRYDLNLRDAFKEALVILSEIDKVTEEQGWNFRMLPNIEGYRADEYTAPESDREGFRTNKYWSLYLRSCQEATRECLEKNWIQREDLECMSSDVIQAVPAASILTILLRSVAEEPTVQSIHWGEGERCDADTCRGDDLANFFWPQLMKIWKQLKDVTEEEQSYLLAKLCANSSSVPSELTAALETAVLSGHRQIELHRLCGDINNVVLVLLRMEQMQELLPRLVDYRKRGRN